MRTIGLLGLPLLCGTGCQNTPPPAARVDFVREIKPFLENRCINCHHSGALLGNLNLETRVDALKARPTGPLIVPGAPDQSQFHRVLGLHETERKAMPPVGHRVSPDELNLIRRWIAEGAAWPEGPDGRLRPAPATPEA